MDDDVRTCGACKGKASLGGVEEHSAKVQYTVSGLPVGTESYEHGATLTYVCACGNEFTFISKLRRARHLGGMVVTGLFAAFWGWLGSGPRGGGMFLPLGGIFGLTSFVLFVLVLADAFSRWRNPPWVGE